jgi:hypothetical protein
MNRLYKAASWLCNCVVVALLILGILAVPETLRADGGKTCEDVCAGAPDYNQCMSQCLALQTHPCGGTVYTANNCVTVCPTYSSCPNNGQGCRGWPIGCQQCNCKEAPSGS